MKIETFEDGSTIETNEETGNRTVCGVLAHKEYTKRLRAEAGAHNGVYTFGANENQKRFLEIYKTQLALVVQESPQDYAWPIANVSAVADKMFAGLLRGSANTEGRAMAGTCKALGIKHTYKAINAFLGVY